jgi:hypothetical protein
VIREVGRAIRVSIARLSPPLQTLSHRQRRGSAVGVYHPITTIFHGLLTDGSYTQVTIFWFVYSVDLTLSRDVMIIIQEEKQMLDQMMEIGLDLESLSSVQELVDHLEKKNS